METALVINPGSSSRKYALYKDGLQVLEFCFENTDTGYEVCSHKQGEQQVCNAISQEGFGSAFTKVADAVKKYLEAEKMTLNRIAIRVVAPGTEFQKHVVIDDVFVSKLQAKEVSVPLHIPAILKELNEAKKLFPDTPLVAVSDSAFHTTMPAFVREYSLSKSDAEAYDIHRFGYHGLSVESVVHRVHGVIGRDPERMVVCHVGNGVSVTAVKDGKSIDTTMGYAPVSGVPMGTRAADLDPSAMLELMRVRNMRPAEAAVYVHTNGGLAGLAGDGDIRRLLDRKSHGDTAATQALDLFAYHIQKAVAGATVALGGFDVLVLTGTAAIRSVELRKLLTDKLSHFGIGIDEDRNDLLVGKEGVISLQRSMVKVVVMRTDEMGEMQRIALQTDVKK